MTHRLSGSAGGIACDIAPPPISGIDTSMATSPSAMLITSLAKKDGVLAGMGVLALLVGRDRGGLGRR